MGNNHTTKSAHHIRKEFQSKRPSSSHRLHTLKAYCSSPIIAKQMLHKYYNLLIEGHNSSIDLVKLTQDDKYIITSSSDDTIRIWSLPEMLQVSVYHTEIRSISVIELTQDGKYLFVGGDNKLILVLDLNANKPHCLISCSTFRLRAIAITSNNLEFATCGLENSISIWSFSEKSMIRKLQAHSEYVYTIRLSKNDKFLVSAGRDKEVIVWDFPSKSILHSFTGHMSILFCAVFSNNSKFIASAGGDEVIKDFSIILWNFDLKRAECTFEGNTARVSSLEFTNDDSHLISASGEGLMRVWNIMKNQLFRVLKSDSVEPVRGLAISVNSSLIVAGGCRVPKVWNWDKGVCRNAVYAHDGQVHAMAVSEELRILAIGDERSVMIWDLAKSEFFKKFNKHKGKIRALEVLDSGAVIVGSDDKCLRIWNIFDETEVYVENLKEFVNCIAISRDQTYLALKFNDKNNRDIVVMGLDAFNQPAKIAIQRCSVDFFAFFHKENRLLTLRVVLDSTDVRNVLEIWAVTGKLIGTILCREAHVTSMRIFQSDKFVVLCIESNSISIVKLSLT